VRKILFFFYHLKEYVIVILVNLLSQWYIEYPWWAYIVPVFVCGLILSYFLPKKSYALIGFVSGFITWVFMNWYFDWMWKGVILGKISAMFGLPTVFVLVIAGCIGGVLSALALYSGVKCIQAMRTSKMDQDRFVYKR
jgi:hypothetical protein